MPHRPPDLRRVFHQETFKKTPRARPLVRLFAVPESAIRQLSFNGTGVRPGERLVWWIPPDDLVSLTEQELLDALHQVLKQLREVRDARGRPTPEDFEILKLREQGRTIPEITELFSERWPNCSDVESRERRVKRSLRRVHSFLDAADAREKADLTPRQRAIRAQLDAMPPIEPMKE